MLLISKNKLKLLSFLIILGVVVYVTAADDILNFYVGKAKSSFETRNPIENGAKYSYRVKSYFKKVIKDGQTKLVDSVETDFYYSFGELDSTRVIVKPKSYSDQVNLNFKNIFEQDYYFYFYPNDTGGTDLSIGFDTYDFDETRPVGFAVIDRSRHFLKWLYLYHINDRKDKRNSRWLRFRLHEGFIFPDSVWELKAIRGVLSTDYYRIETGITDFKISR